MRWIEHITSRAVNYSNLSGFVGTRAFKVWGGVSPSLIISSPESVIDDNTAQALPAYDSPWPDTSIVNSNAAKLDEYQVSINNDTLIVSAIYTDRRARLGFESTHQLVNDEFPIERLVRFRSIGSSSEGQPEPVSASWVTQMWERPSSAYRFYVVRFIRREHFESVSSVTAALSSAISKQVNRLHAFRSTISGDPPSSATVWGRFEGATIQQQTGDRYQIRYAWLVDSGVAGSDSDLTYVPPTGGGQDSLEILPEVNIPRLGSHLGLVPPGENSYWLRPPFERVDRIFPRDLTPDANGIPPRSRYYGTLRFLPYPYIPDPLPDGTNASGLGWMMLPGMEGA